MFNRIHRNTIKYRTNRSECWISIFFVFSLTIFSSCTANNSDTTPPTIVTNPKILTAPNASTPLVGVLELTTDEPTSVSIFVSNESDSWAVDFDEFNTDHSLPVLGFHPGKKHEVLVIVLDRSGNETAAENVIEVTTEPLPTGFPQIKTLISMPDEMEPGITIFPVQGRGIHQEFGDAIVAVDELGEVVWYHKPSGGFSDVRRLSNGNILYEQNRQKIVEIDMLGSVIQKWHPSRFTEGDEGSTPVDAEAFHHEVFEMVSGNFLVLSVELRTLENYPTSTDDPFAPTETAVVAGDVIVEFTRDGTVVNEWSLLDLLDPYRLGYGSLIGFWDAHFPEITEGTKDWAHANAVIHDTRDDSIIISSRHQDALVKFSRATGQLIWILGTPNNWDQEVFGEFLLTPTADSEFEFPFHEHAPKITPDGNILLFDNGNFRATPFDEPLPPTENFSRAVEFSIDEDSMEFTQVWEYGQFTEETLYASFLGDSDILPKTGNVLITFGGINTDTEGNATESPLNSINSARIIEVTHITPAEKVFDLSIADDSPDLMTGGWVVYRSERLPSLYP